jgi:UDP-N-acetylmuramoyl-L-alanyl-D-glutamate--2,6-diaminopimelate ligase
MTVHGRRRLPLQALLDFDPALELVGDPATQIAGIAYDSREVETGDLFAALPGADFDGHEFAWEATGSGAAALLVERRLDLDVPQLVAPSSRAALAGVAATFYGHPSREIAVAGVTGTDGKTTTTYLVDAILRHAGLRTGAVGTVAVRIGDQVDHHATRQTTPESSEVQRFLRDMVGAETDWAILEATSHGLDLHRLDHVQFQIGAVTNVTHEHLEHHGSVAAYRRAKGILFERVAEAGGVAVVNVDDDGARSMLSHARGAQVVAYSAEGNQGADLQADRIELRSEGTCFRLTFRETSAPVRLPLIGRFNVENALCAAGVGLAAGLDLDAVARGLARAPQVPGRLARVECGQPFSVIVDYAHTPAALETVLRLIRKLSSSGRLISVFGSAGERDVAKRAMQGAVSARLADVTIATSEDPRNEDPEVIVAAIADGAEAAGARPGESLYSIVDRREAIRFALSLASPGDCLLLAGKGHEQSIIWGREKLDWDEATVAREELVRLGFGGEA